MRRTKAEAAETRDAILAAAEAVFLERGVNQATLNEIACRAGVTRGAIYFHFHDKRDVFHAIIARARFPQEEIMAQAARCEHPDPLDVLQQSILAALTLFQTDARQQNIFTIIRQRCEYVGEMAAVLERLKEARADVLALFRGLLDVAERRGELASGWSAVAAAPILLAMVCGLLTEWLHGDRDFDLAGGGGRAVATFIRSLKAGRG